jgi:hypothetical protein
MTGQRARMRMIRPEQEPVSDGEEFSARAAAEKSDDAFRTAMAGAGYQASEPVHDASPLVGTKFHAEPKSLGNSSMAGI